MSLFSAFNAAIGGLGVQSSNIATSADNMANLNTVGFKGAEAQAFTIISDTASTSSFSAGGVQSVTRRNIDQQGTLESTGVVTDMAVSGEGFFVVNSETDGTGDYSYTRAGSFRADSEGNLVNAQDQVLFGWELDNQSRLPGETGNLNTTSSALLTSTKAVNVNAVTGIAAATSTVSFKMNIDAGQETLQGSGDVINVVETSIENRSIGDDDIIYPQPSNGNRLAQFSGTSTITFTDGITITAGGQTNTYTFGGIEMTPDITTAPGIAGVTTASTMFSGADDGDSFTINTATVGTVTFTFKPSAPNAVLGQFNNLNNLATAIDTVTGLTSRVVNNRLFVAPTDATEAMTFARVGGDLSPQTSGDLTATAVLGANTAATDFTGATTGDGFIIQIGAVSKTYTYNPAGTGGVGVDDLFQNLNEIRDQINNDFAGTPAAVAGGVLTITDANLKFIDDYNPVGSSNFATALGIRGLSWPKALELNNTTATTNRFATLGGLSTLINTASVTKTVLENPLSATTVGVYSTDPTGTIQFSNTTNNVAFNDFLEEFDVVSTLFTAAYDPSSETKNMAGGNVTPQFTRNIQIFDSLGAAHDFRLSFVKTATNTWGVELYAVTATDISSTRTDGQVASGTVTFNGDGSLRNVSSGLANAISIAWTNGATASSITVDYGTAGSPEGTTGATVFGKTDGLRQFDADYNVEQVEQNGQAAGLLSSIGVDAEGFVTANFSNGETKKIFRIPLARFANPNGLTAKNGNVFSESRKSGTFNLSKAASAGTGSVIAATLEGSNAELSKELTNLIRAQRAFQSNTQSIRTANTLLEELTQVAR